MSATDARTLAAARRDRTGSRYARRARDEGRLPAVIYGHKTEPVAITLDAHEALIAFHRGEKLFTLQMDGTTETVLLKDVGFDHLGTNIIHADFARVDLEERVVVHARVVLVGSSPGLKRAGAVLDHPVTELTIECRVTNIPDQIEVDMSQLDLGHVIHARDVQLPLPTMRLLTDPEAVIARVEVRKGDDSADSGEAAVVAPNA